MTLLHREVVQNPGREQVAVEATTTLRYYPALGVVRSLADLLTHAAEPVRQVARESLDEIHYTCLAELHSRDRRVADHVRRWLEPIWDVLAFTEEVTRLLAEPPTVTWALQVAVLDAVAELGLLCPNIRHLREVDVCHDNRIQAVTTFRLRGRSGRGGRSRWPEGAGDIPRHKVRG